MHGACGAGQRQGYHGKKLIEEDDELYMIGYYLRKGHSLSELIALTPLEKIFFMQNINIEREEEAKKINAMMGGG